MTDGGNEERAPRVALAEGERKVRAITRYVSFDNVEWNTSQEATSRDLLITWMKPFDALLGPKVESSTRRRIDPAMLIKVKTAVVEKCRQLYPGERIFKHDPMEIHPGSYAGRFLSDVGGPLNEIWWRFSCIDANGWMYDQPFFANNPSEFSGKSIELPPQPPSIAVGVRAMNLGGK